MILPTKQVGPNRALITVGADVLGELAPGALTVSSLWERVRKRVEARSDEPLMFDWFILALDLLFTLDAIELTGLSLIERRRS